MFMWARYSGIPRYFIELITQYQKDKSIDVSLPRCYCMNRDYQSLFPKASSSFHWKINDILIDTAIKYLHKNPAEYISKPIESSIASLQKNDYDVFHPTHFNPYFLKYIGSNPFVITVHDLTIERYPEYSAAINLSCNNTKLLSDSAPQIIAISENTKKEFIEYYDVDKDKVTVVYHASSYTPEKISRIPSVQTVTKRPYLLYVNHRGGHKNFMTLVVAIAKLLLRYDLALVCVGGGPFSSIEKALFNELNVSSHIIQCSLDNIGLCQMYKCAVAFVFPSVNEGFGLPILDAFACGCPAVVSNTSCLPEIGGDAAVYFSPKDLKSICDSVERVIIDEKLREKMRGAGYKQLENFSWKKCARETKTVYEKAMEQ